MTELHIEWVWSGTRKAVGLTELSRVCAMTIAELDELVEYGALLPLESLGLPDPHEPLEPQPADLAQRLFTAECVTTLRAAGKLRRDFDLDLFAVAFLMDYLNRIEALEDQVRSLQARVSARTLTEPLV